MLKPSTRFSWRAPKPPHEVDIPAVREALTDRLGLRLRPLLPEASDIDQILLDPSIAFGRPTLHGIRADVLHSRFESGEDVASIADDYGIEPDEVEQAIRFDALAAA